MAWSQADAMIRGGTRVLLFANTDWYLYNFRLSLALALRDLDCEVVLVAPDGPYASRFSSHGLRFVPFAFDRLSLNPLHQVSAVARLAALYRREQPDLVHHFTIKCAVYGSLAARAVGPSAVVNAFTGLGSVFSERAGRFRQVRAVVLGTMRIALSGTHVIVQNPEDRDLVLTNRLSATSDITLIRGSGVDLNRFTPRATTNREPLRVLLASRLIRSKGIEAFEMVASRLRSLRNAEFLIAGAPDHGNPDTLVPADIDALSVRGNVRLLGHVDDMPGLLSSVDLVVLPTTYGEGVPRILVEAAASGLPLVATDVPGCREIVRQGLNGTLVNPDDVDALTQSVDALLLDSDARARMGDVSRKMAGEFAETRVIADTLRCYAALLERRGPRALRGVPTTV